MSTSRPSVLPEIHRELGYFARTAATKYLRCQESAGQWSANLLFLQVCFNIGVIPSACKDRRCAHTEAEKAWIRNSEIRLLRIKIASARQQKYTYIARAYRLRFQLSSMGMSWKLQSSLFDFGERRLTSTFQALSTRKSRKFAALCCKAGLTPPGSASTGATTGSQRNSGLAHRGGQNPSAETGEYGGYNGQEQDPRPRPPQGPPPLRPGACVVDREKAVLNLSSTTFSPEQLSSLQYGQRFSLPTTKLNYPDMIARAEGACQAALKNGKNRADVEAVRSRAAIMVSKAEPPVPTRLLSSVRKAIKEVQQMESVVVLGADKVPNGFVIMDSKVHSDRVKDLLDQPAYEKLPGDPSERYIKEFSDVLKKVFCEPFGGKVTALSKNDPRRHSEYTWLRKTHGRCAPVYALAKSHKIQAMPESQEERLAAAKSIPLRLIAPCYRSVDYQASAMLNRVIQSIPKSPFAVNSAVEFLEEVLDLEVPEGSLLFSVDIVNMFGTVPISETIDLIERELTLKPSTETHLSPSQACSLLRIICRNGSVVFTDFRGDTNFYRQVSGFPMGRAFSPSACDVFMKEWEKDIVQSAQGKLLHFRRYVDDSFGLWCGSQESLVQWVDSLNMKHQSIGITLEVEVNGRLPFLDIQLTRSSGRIQSSVYRKPSNANLKVAFASFCPIQYRVAAIRSDVYRAMTYCRSPSSRGRELAFIKRVYSGNGFCPSDIEKIIAKAKRSHYVKHQPAGPGQREEGGEKPIRVAFPFVPSVFYPLCRLGRKIGIQFVAQKSTSLSSLLCSRAKNKLRREQESGVVYQVQCDCGMHYTGESEREVQTRVAEHKTGFDQRKPKSAFGNHLDHTPDFEGYKILAREPRTDLRRIQEAVFITKGHRNVIESQSDWITNRSLGKDYSKVWEEVVAKLDL